MTGKKKASAATRQIRWVEGFKDDKQPVFWGQVKKVKKGDREISVPTDRRSNFEYPRDPKVKKAKPQPKHSSDVREALQEAAGKVIAQIQKIADGTVTSFFYSAEANELRYSQTIKIDGQTITENQTTDDETLLEAAQDFADMVADAVASDGKTLSVADGPEPAAAPSTDEDEE